MTPYEQGFQETLLKLGCQNKTARTRWKDEVANLSGKEKGRISGARGRGRMLNTRDPLDIMKSKADSLVTYPARGGASKVRLTHPSELRNIIKDQSLKSLLGVQRQRGYSNADRFKQLSGVESKIKANKARLDAFDKLMKSPKPLRLGDVPMPPKGKSQGVMSKIEADLKKIISDAKKQTKSSPNSGSRSVPAFERAKFPTGKVLKSLGIGAGLGLGGYGLYRALKGND